MYLLLVRAIESYSTAFIPRFLHIGSEFEKAFAKVGIICLHQFLLYFSVNLLAAFSVVDAYLTNDEWREILPRLSQVFRKHSNLFV